MACSRQRIMRNMSAKKAGTNLDIAPSSGLLRFVFVRSFDGGSNDVAL
jgi:hypothetical protein